MEHENKQRAWKSYQILKEYQNGYQVNRNYRRCLETKFVGSTLHIFEI